MSAYDKGVDYFKPTQAPTEMSISRDGTTWTANWKIPGKMLDTTTNPHKCYTGLQVYCRADVSNKKKGKDPKVKDIETSASATSYSIALNGFNLDANKLHPKKPGVYLEHVIIKARGFHDIPKDKDSKGNYKYKNHGKRAFSDKWSGAAKFTVKEPKKPTVELEYDTSNAHLTATVKSTGGDDIKEMWSRTAVQIVINKQNGKNETYKDTYTTLEEWTHTVDLSSYLTGLQDTSNSVTVTCYATAQGFGGDSDKASKSYTVRMSPRATIKGVTKDGQRIRVKIDSPGGGDLVTLQLQRRKGEEGETWEDVSGGTDDGGAPALYDSIGNAEPIPGKYTYYRVKSSRQGYDTYSEPYKAECLYEAESKNKCAATCEIVKVTSALNGESAQVVMAFSDSTVNDGCELSWSKNITAWVSTESPNVQEFTGTDATKDPAASRYNASKTVTLQNTVPGETCYIKMRRYREVGNEKVYSDYSKIWTFSPESAEDDECAIVSIEKIPGGTEAQIVIGINEDNPNTGTQVQWSDYQYAWYSNKEPSDLLAKWDVDDPKKDNNWDKTQTVYLTDLQPDTTYYIKARRYLESSSGTTSSNWSQYSSFTTPNSAFNPDVRCGMVSVSPNDDGDSVVVVLGWDGDHTGCEVSWSEHDDAWESTESPSSTTFEWSDTENASGYYAKTTDTVIDSSKTYYTRSGEEGSYTYTEVASPSASNLSSYYELLYRWSHTSTIVVRGLDDGVLYYFRGRSYHDQKEGETEWSDYTEHMSATSYSIPDEVVLTAPSSVARGESIDAYWTISGELEQKEWSIHPSDNPNIAYADGEGSVTHGVIEPDRYGDAESISFYVDAGVGGALRSSNTVTVGIGDVPECTASCTQTLTAQPASVEVHTNDSACSLLVTLTSGGITYAGPGGDSDQIDGDVIWTAPVIPEWTVSGQGYATTVSMPSDLFLVDSGTYTFSVKAVEPVHGLVSEAAEASFTVTWSHQAPVPSSSITVTPDEYNRSAIIELAAPQNAAQTDVYDIYRKTPTGYDLVAKDVPLAATVTDPYAPYGIDADLSYRICCRTIDGDEEFADYEYELPIRLLRFDWDGWFVELPLNIETDESYEKTFELRSHLDGSMVGYYEKGVKIEGSYSSDINKIEGLDIVNLVKRMGEYDGPCFCRTQHGAAFQCNVDVNSLSTHYSSAAVPVRIKATAMDLTSMYMLTDSNIEVS